MDLCAYEIQGHGVGVGVKSTLLSDTLQSIGLAESTPGRSKVWFRKKPIDLWASESEEREHGVAAGVNAIIRSDVLY